LAAFPPTRPAPGCPLLCLLTVGIPLPSLARYQRRSAKSEDKQLF
jgi:hypothetical protein